MKTLRVLGCIAGLFLNGWPVAHAQESAWKIVNSYPVPGEGGFDYIVLDPSGDRLYVSHGTKVDVVDAKSGRVLGSVQNTPGVHGIAIVPELHRGFTTNGGNATISVFDTTTFKTIKTIPVEKDPDFTLYDPSTKRVLVCHGDAAQIIEIDPERMSVVGKIALGGGAEAAVVNPSGNGFVNLEEEAEVVHFNSAKLTVLDKWPITGCKTPTGLAMDPDSNRLFIGCRSKVLAIMDASNGHVIQTLPIGERVDAVAFDKTKKLIFASNGGGTISVVHQDGPNAYSSLPDIKTQPSAKTMAFDPKSEHLFLSAADMEPAADGKGRPHPKPGTFKVLVVGE